MRQYKYKLKQGFKWMCKFNYTNPKTGKIETEYKRGFASKKEAKIYEENFLDNLPELCEEEDLTEETGDEDKIEPVSKTFGEVFSEYMNSHRREGIKESTKETKLSIFNKYIFPFFEDRRISGITDDDIAKWQNKIKAITFPDGRGLSDSYLRTIQSQFNTIINYARGKGYIRHNPLVDIKNMGYKNRRMDYWTSEEYEIFAYHAMNWPKYYYAYEILYWCGLRLGETLALTSKDIDLKKGIISVDKTLERLRGRTVITTPKTPSSVRKVSMPAFLCDEIKEYLALLYNPQPDQRIFLFNHGAINRNFNTIIEEAGLKRIPIHGLRHSHVSLLINQRYDIFEISKRIGHKSISTTQDIYGHLFDETQKEIAENLDRIRQKGA